MKFRFNLNPFARALLIGSLALSATACNDDDDAPAVVVVVPPANVAPVVSSAAVTSAEEGVVYTYTLTATDADAGDTLELASLTLPTWLTFDITSGELSGTPAAADVGDNAVSLTVTDGTDTTTQDFTIAVTAAPVVNTAPTFTSTGLAMGAVGTVYSYTATATDLDTGDTLMLSSVVLPTWGAFDSSTGILSGTPDMAGSYDAELMVSDGTDSVNQTFTIVVTEASAMTIELVVFENAALPEWAAWINDGGSTEVVTDDVEHDQATKFTLTGPSVAGFTARELDGAVGGVPFDASALTSTGSITFELKMLKAPDAGVVDWKFKVEGAGASELSLSTSVEGHATPLLDTWQTYTFPISALTGLDASNMDLFMVFPNYNDAAGAEFLLDNVKIISGVSEDDETGPVAGIADIGDTGLVANGGFESGDLTGWLAGGGVTVVPDDMGTYLVKIVAAEAQNENIYQDKIGEGVFSAGQALTVSFDMRGTAVNGGVVSALLYTDDPSMVSKTEELLPLALNESWTNYTFNVIAGDPIGRGVSLRLAAVCGAVSGCEVTAYFDNVSITAQ
jgi:hypothetical protein